MATTFAEFQALPEREQYAVVYREGVTVSQRRLGEHTVKLCQMAGQFFAEVAYHPGRCALVFVAAFPDRDPDRLTPYRVY